MRPAYGRGMSVVSALSLSRTPALGFMAIGLVWGAFAAAVPELKAQLGASDRDFGLAMLGNALGLILAMRTAPFLDRRLGKRGLQVAIVGYALAVVWPALTFNLLTFTLSMVCLGAASGLLDVLINTRVSELEAKTRRPLMNANHGMFSVAYAIAAFTMGQVRGLGVHPSVLFCVIAVILMAFAAFMAMDPDEAGAEDTPPRGWNPVVILCGLIVLIAFMAEATVETWSALHIERTLGGIATEGALGPTMLGITMAVGRLGGQYVIDRVSEQRLLIYATLCTFVGTLAVAGATSPAMAYAGFGVMGLGVSVIGPLGLAMVGHAARPAERTRAMAQAALLGFSGFFFAPALMGLLSEGFGLRVAYLCVALLVLGLLPLIVSAKRRL